MKPIHLALAFLLLLAGCASKAQRGTAIWISDDRPENALASVAVDEVRKFDGGLSQDYAPSGSLGSAESASPWTGKGTRSLSFAVQTTDAADAKATYLVVFESKNGGPWKRTSLQRMP